MIRSFAALLAAALLLGSAAPLRAGAAGAQAAESQVLLLEARRYFDALDYEKAVASLDRVIVALEARPPADPARKDLPAAYEMRGRSRFGLGDQEGARADFQSLLKMSPAYTLTDQVSPRVVALFDEAIASVVTTMTLTVVPASAEVTLDGVPINAGGSIPVAVGEHVVTAKQLGYRGTAQTIQIEAGKTAELALALERISAVLTILTSPDNVEVIIDGTSHGRTAAGPAPVKFAEAAAKAGVPMASTSAVMIVPDLPPGSHRVEFKRDCYMSAERRVVVEKPDDYSIDPVKLDHAVATLSVTASQPVAQVVIDGQVRGVAPLSVPDLCEGEHTVELRSNSGRYFKRIQPRTGDKIEVTGTIKPAFALVATNAAASPLNADLRLVLERIFEPAQTVTIFAPSADQVEQATKGQSLPAGWFAFDAKRRPIGVASDVSAPMRQDLSIKLSATFDAQGIASVTVPSSAERNHVVLSLLGAGSGQPDVIELTLDDPESIRAAIAQLNRDLSFFKPSIGLTAVDVADVAGAVVVGVVANGPAAKAAVQIGDIVTKVNAQAVSDAAALATALAGHKANDDLTLELKPRAGPPKQADVKVVPTPRLIGLADQTVLANAVLLDLRARLTRTTDPLEESVIRLNVAAVLARLGAWSDSRQELQRVKLPDGPGVSNGTVEYLVGLCADRLGNRSEAETAWKAAAASDSLLTEDGPPIKELAEARLAELQRGSRPPGAR